MQQSNPASQLAAMRKRIEARCSVCGASMVKLQTARYCSNACRQRAKYERQKADSHKVKGARIMNIIDSHEHIVVMNVETVRECIGAIDQGEHVNVGDTISHYSCTYDGDQRGSAVVWHNQQRAAICFGGDSEWGDWDSDSNDIRLADHQDTIVYHIGAGEIFEIGEDPRDGFEDAD